MEINIIGILRIAVCGIATLLCILAMALPDWVNQESTDAGKTTKSNSGLWKACTETPDDGTKCTPTTIQAAFLMLVGFLVTLGVILLIGTLFCAVLHVIKSDNATVVYAGGIMAAAAGILQLIAFAAFADYMAMAQDAIKGSDNISMSYGASFGLDIVTCILSLVTAVLFIGPQLRAIPDS